MKKLLIILVMVSLVACAGKLHTKAGDIVFELTPDMVEMIFNIATRAPRGTALQTVGVDSKTLAIVADDSPVDDLKAWGNVDGILTRGEAIFIAEKLAKLKTDFVFRNSQGDQFKISSTEPEK